MKCLTKAEFVKDVLTNARNALHEHEDLGQHEDGTRIERVRISFAASCVHCQSGSQVPKCLALTTLFV